MPNPTKPTAEPTLDEGPDVIGVMGAVPLPTLSDALRAIAEFLAADTTEEAAHEALVLQQAAHRMDDLEHQLARQTALLRKSLPYLESGIWSDRKNELMKHIKRELGDKHG